MLKSLFTYYKPYRRTVWALLLLSLFSAALDLVFPMLVRHIMDVELPGKNIENIFRMIVILFVLYCVSFVLSYIVQYKGTLVSVHMENDMRQDLFRHLEKMSFRYFDDNKTGQLLSRITTDLTEIGELTFKGPNDVLICSITMLGTIAILIWMNPVLASFIVLLLVAKTVHTVYINRKMKQRFRANRAKNAESAKAARALVCADAASAFLALALAFPRRARALRIALPPIVRSSKRPRSPIRTDPCKIGSASATIPMVIIRTTSPTRPI